MDLFAYIIITVASSFLYFVPSILAFMKNKPNRNRIILINFFLGWTIFGWAAALYLVWKNNHGKVSF
ncbi:superinfection immunity protein [Gracilibacillus oryzae]|uniref:Superinfection immunity protein n=1 Tax=Gracilibacillus oryzae TaxID=1672701 RepID=A0A7C8GSU2_9BACI|nr:superinfection immunity protein [Gracilibacillus oryzae]KAB8130764.1 superinfection immunity protein [Gracilibacillus oryzae]